MTGQGLSFDATHWDQQMEDDMTKVRFFVMRHRASPRFWA